MDYSMAPNFDEGQARKVRRMKKALSHDHSDSFKKRIQGKLNGLYGDRRAARTKYNETPLYGQGTYTGGRMDQQVNSAVNGKYGSAIKDTSTQIGSAPYRQAQISKYYDDYNAELNSLRTQQAAQAQSMIDQQAANQSSTQKLEGQANTSAATELSADAASRGQTADTSQITKANQASAARATTGNTQQAALMQAKNAYDNYYGQQSLTAKGAKQGSLQDEAKFTNTLRDKLIGLKKEAGDYATTTRGALDEAQFQRGISQQALGLKKSAQSLAAQKESRIASGGSGSSGGETGAAPKGKGGAFTSTQIHNNKSTYRNLKGKATAALTTVDPTTGKPILTGGGAPAQEFINALIAKGADPLLAEAAVLSALKKAGKSKRSDKQLGREVHKNFGFWPGI